MTALSGNVHFTLVTDHGRNLERTDVNHTIDDSKWPQDITFIILSQDSYVFYDVTITLRRLSTNLQQVLDSKKTRV